MKVPFSIYDYLGFLLPGGLIVAFSLWGWCQCPSTEPGASAGLGLAAVAFIVGHVNVAIANVFVQPMAFGLRPATRPSPVIGIVGKSVRYDEAEQERIVEAFETRYGRGSNFAVLFDLGYADLRRRKIDGPLQIYIQQMAFYRNMASAIVVSIGIMIFYRLIGRPGIPLWPWLPILAVALPAFVYRLRRNWFYFGDNVVRIVRLLPADGA